MCTVYYEPAKEVPVIGVYDVIVAGGGAAGCAAALYAARHGAEVLLIEKDGYLGGATVSQLVAAVLSTNGVDFQGVWHEFMQVMKRREGVSELTSYPGISYLITGRVNPEVVKYAWDELLQAADVKILHHVLIAGSIVEDRTIKGLLVETKSGRRAVYGRRMIDCTGDGAVAALAGVPWDQGDGQNKYAMACTKVYRLENVTEIGGVPTEEMKKDLEQKWWAYMQEQDTTFTDRGYVPNFTKILGSRLPYTRQVMMATSRVLKVDPLDPWDLTRAEREGREQDWLVADFIRKYVPHRADSYLLDTSGHIGVRSTRRIHSMACVTTKDVLEFTKYPDEIARGSWDIDIWPADSYINPSVSRHTDEYRARIEKMKQGEYYSIRYGCLVARSVDNLLVAGRSISSEHIAQSSLRIQQTCMATGQAAGTAAAISLRDGVAPGELDPMQVVRQLELDRSKVEPAFDLLKNLPEVGTGQVL